MERLTHERVNGIKTGYWSAATKEVLVQKLAAYENTGYEPDEIRAAIEQAAKSSETKTATVMAECMAAEPELRAACTTCALKAGVTAGGKH